MNEDKGKLMHNNNKLLSTTVMVLGTMISGATSAESILLEEVKVLAQKKSAAENVQDVPISMTAYSGEQVEAIFATDLTDIGLTAPNVNLAEIPTFPGVANFVIRGMGTVGQSIPSADPAVGVVMDGVALGTIYGVVTDLWDVESIEVLRGPQGTLFGRNVTGGAVAIRSKRPTEDLEGKLLVSAGNYGQKKLGATLSGPVNENWGAKIAVLSNEHDGYWSNRTLGGDHGESKTLLVRPAVSYKGDGFDATLIAEKGSIEGDGLGAIAWWADGGAAGGGFEIDPYDDRVTYQDETGENDLEWIHASLETNWDLWNGVLTGVLGYRDLEQHMISDVDGYLGARFHFADGTSMDQEQTSVELRWAGDLNETLSLTAGVYFFDQQYYYAERRILVDAVDRRGVSTIDHKTQGVFAQADYLLREDLTLTIGGRYTSEEKDARIGIIGDPNATGDCATVSPPLPSTQSVSMSDCRPALIDSEKWANFTPKLGLTWQLSEDIMAYASYSRGFRSGGYNVRFTDLSFASANPASTPGPYDEEVVDAFELGMKSDLWDGMARLNVALFNNKYDDLQRTSINASGGQEILNAASAVIRGVEIDGMLAITDEWLLQMGLGYTDAEYDDFASAEQVTGKKASDLRFVMVPELTYNLAAIYEKDITDQMVLNGRISYSYVDDVFSDDYNRVAIDDYGLIDASLTLTLDTQLKVSLFGKNLTDEVYYDFGTNFSTSSLAVQSFWLTPPRTYGLEMTYEF